jgi:hypothetical protein
MKYTSKFIFSTLFLSATLTLFAQKNNDSLLVKKDSIKPKTEKYGLRLGADLYKLTRSFYDNNYKGFELVGDYRLTRKHYLAAEIGNENKTVNEPQLNFTTKGSYIKAGFDYNTYQNWVGMQNMVYVGLRYGVASFSQTRNSYKIYNTNTYFGEEPTIIEEQKFNGLSAHWIEVVAGIKVEIFKNCFVGFSARLNRLVSNQQPDNFENLYIPGFNRTYGGEFGAGFNYTVSYFVPLYKSTVKPKKKK